MTKQLRRNNLSYCVGATPSLRQPPRRTWPAFLTSIHLLRQKYSSPMVTDPSHFVLEAPIPVSPSFHMLDYGKVRKWPPASCRIVQHVI
jgi:hypothetical protein